MMKSCLQNDDKKAAKDMWHRRRGYTSNKIVFGMINHKNCRLKDITEAEEQKCKTCIQAKNIKTLANGKSLEGSRDVTIHVDICGPISVRSIGGSSYFSTMRTARERYTRIEALKNKGEVMEHVMEYITWSNFNSKESAERVHSDNAKEFLAIWKELNRLGIGFMATSLYSSESN